MIKDKTIWLTGAGSGIGRALAFKLADAGNFVVISGRRESVLNEMVRQRPNNMHALPVDVSDATARQAVTKKLRNITDSLDILIMAAGVVAYEDNLDFSDEKYQQVFGTNYFGMVNTVAIAKPLLKKTQQKAYIVGLSSLSMVIGFPRAEAYGASKAAADYFLQSLSLDLPRRYFDVSIVRPGFVDTPMTSMNDFPMPFILTAEEAADRILKGMERRRRLIVFPKRLDMVLKLMSLLSLLWYRYIGVKASRNQL